MDNRLDLLAVTRLGRAFWTDPYDSHIQPPNIARFHFLDPASHRFYPDWDQIADRIVDVLRTEAGRDPYDKSLHDLVGELSTRSDVFRTRWGGSPNPASPCSPTPPNRWVALPPETLQQLTAAS